MKKMIVFFVLSAFIVFGTFGCINKEPSDASKHSKLVWETYWDDILRFPVKVAQPSNLEFLQLEYPGQNFKKFDYVFEQNKRLIHANSSSIKFGKYLFTKNKEYIFVKIGENWGWIKYKTDLSVNSKKYIRSLKDPKDIYDSIEAIPFNDQNYLLVYGNIIDLEKEKTNWTIDGYYEAPYINFKTDMLESTGDLTTTVYIFDKLGQLKQVIQGEGPI